MSGLLGDRLAEYLAMRRALGYGLRRQEKLLVQYLDWLAERGEDRITTANALAWATLPAGGEAWRSYRLAAVRGFARYLIALDPEVEVPAAELLPDQPHRATPYLYTDAQIAALMRAARTLSTPHRAATYATLIGLLAVTGMRIGEAIALDRSDLDNERGVLVVRAGKQGKSRELPLHESATAAIGRYLRRSDRPSPKLPEPALFVSAAGTRLLISNVWCTFSRLRSRAGIEARSPGCRPRIHDVRHTYAVNTILDAYRSGEDAGPRLALLATYMGHVDPKNTYWYLQAAPELMALAGQRLDRYLGEPA
jgi:integrase